MKTTIMEINGHRFLEPNIRKASLFIIKKNKSKILWGNTMKILNRATKRKYGKKDINKRPKNIITIS